MTHEPRILILENSPADEGLDLRELRQEGIEFKPERVQTKEAFLKALTEFAPDVILSSYSLQEYNGLEALRLSKEINPQTPFILITDPLTEEVAIECMKAGAADYILRSNLDKLPSAVLNVLEKSALLRAEEAAVTALRESEKRFRTFIETTNELIWSWDLEFHCTYVNPAVEKILGYRPEEFIGEYLIPLIHEEDLQHFASKLPKLIVDKQGWTGQVLRWQHKNGSFRYLESNAVPILDGNGAFIGFHGSDRDITERKQTEEQLLHDAFHDGLTGLANRTLFINHLQMAIERGKRNKHALFAVLFLDFDRFKVINDSLGHAEGDLLLQQVARRLESSLRTSDLIARLGGDEFTILLNEIDNEKKVLNIVERIQDELKAPFNLRGREIYISVSIGIATSTHGYIWAEDMLRDADTAMYRAKSKGKAQYQIFDQTMHNQAVSRLQLETDIHQALEREEFSINYQPIMNLQTNDLEGFEALVRWRHPKLGMVMPGDFIPATEESGLIIPLGQWTIHESCRQLKEWQNRNETASSLTISVNLSSKQFLQHDLAEQISQILRETKLDPNCLKLEITETYLLENSDTSIEIMNSLRSLGVELSLDDFGTGYSSLSYLHRLPVSCLKIDRSFVNRMIESTESNEIVRTIIKLGQNLKMKVIAEGIETAEQLAHLQELNCNYGQGYFFSKPLEADKAGCLISGKTPALPLETNPAAPAGLKLVG